MHLKLVSKGAGDENVCLKTVVNFQVFCAEDADNFEKWAFLEVEKSSLKMVLLRVLFLNVRTPKQRPSETASKLIFCSLKVIVFWKVVKVLLR